jgi:MFS family permease
LITSTFGTPIYIAAIQTVGEEFHVGITLAIAPASLYAYGVGIGALVGTAACEVFGRRIVYQVTIPLSLIFTIVGGSAKTFATIAVARSLSGIFAGPSLSIGAGIINDLWDVSLDKRGTAFALLYAFTNIWATNCGPMASAALITHHSWRWVFWCPAILLGITAVAAFLIPETYTPQILRSRAKRNKLFVGDQRASLDLFLTSVGRPLHMILVEPVRITSTTYVVVRKPADLLCCLKIC